VTKKEEKKKKNTHENKKERNAVYFIDRDKAEKLKVGLRLQ
jgi:hypothetical protein